jgi:hypothetical protein
MVFGQSVKIILKIQRIYVKKALYTYSQVLHITSENICDNKDY